MAPDRNDLLAVLPVEVERLVDRLRPASATWWAAVGRRRTAYHLATRLVVLGRRLEERAGPPLPEAEQPDVLADQIAVATWDLLLAAGGHQAPEPALAEALGEVLLHRHDLDGAQVPAGPARLLTGEDFLPWARRRCQSG